LWGRQVNIRRCSGMCQSSFLWSKLGNLKPVGRAPEKNMLVDFVSLGHAQNPAWFHSTGQVSMYSWRWASVFVASCRGFICRLENIFVKWVQFYLEDPKCYPDSLLPLPLYATVLYATMRPEVSHVHCMLSMINEWMRTNDKRNSMFQVKLLGETWWVVYSNVWYIWILKYKWFTYTRISNGIWEGFDLNWLMST